MDGFCGIIDKPDEFDGEFRVEVIVGFGDNFGFRERLDNCLEISDRLCGTRVVGKRLDFMFAILALAVDTVGRTRTWR